MKRATRIRATAVDKIFGTAYLPKDKRPSGFGTRSPVPEAGYFQHLAYPFTQKARADTAVGLAS